MTAANSDNPRQVYEFGPFRLEVAERRLLRDDSPVALAPKVFDTLLVLVRAEGRLVDKDALMRSLWPETVVEENNLTVNISALRKALGDGVYIETVPKRGYRFAATVTCPEWSGLAIGTVTRSTITIEEEHLSDLPRELRRPVARRQYAAVILSAVVLLAAAPALWLWHRSDPPPATASVRSIAVLPFRWLGADGADEHLGLGIADTLITRLGSTGQLTVRTTSAIRPFAGEPVGSAEAGRALRVDAVLEGTLQRSGDRLRVTARLVRVSDGSQLWAASFDEPVADVLAIEDSVSQRVAEALTLRLTDDVRHRLTQHSTDDVEAYRSYVKGRYFWNKRSRDGFKKATAFFQTAIDLDPLYARAWAGLADCHAMLGSFGVSPPEESFPRAKAAARRALEIDSALAEPHATLGYVATVYDWDWEAADSELCRAIELDPEYASAHQWYSLLLGIVGRSDDAFVEAGRAETLDPLSTIISSDVAGCRYERGDYAGAAEKWTKTLELDPSFGYAHANLGMAYMALGRYDEAVAECDRAMEIDGAPEAERAALRRAYAASGIRGYLSSRAGILETQARSGRAVSVDVATLYVKLGDRDRALTWLERGYVTRDPAIVFLKSSPDFDPLRAEPRFVELLAKLRLQ